ncbi:hypothetical protein HYS91_05475 [Candidatus Daviesbacteria bacterium]|nr:hypothetical protein [Candidatus Daviesbacteria bacterium]
MSYIEALADTLKGRIKRAVEIEHRLIEGELEIPKGLNPSPNKWIFFLRFVERESIQTLGEFGKREEGEKVLEAAKTQMDGPSLPLPTTKEEEVGWLRILWDSCKSSASLIIYDREILLNGKEISKKGYQNYLDGMIATSATRLIRGGLASRAHALLNYWRGEREQMLFKKQQTLPGEQAHNGFVSDEGVTEPRGVRLGTEAELDFYFERLSNRIIWRDELLAHDYDPNDLRLKAINKVIFHTAMLLQENGQAEKVREIMG